MHFNCANVEQSMSSEDSYRSFLRDAFDLININQSGVGFRLSFSITLPNFCLKVADDPENCFFLDSGFAEILSLFAIFGDRNCRFPVRNHLKGSW